MFRKKNKSIIVSYVALRRLIGILGILLPFICVVGGLAPIFTVSGPSFTTDHNLL